MAPAPLQKLARNGNFAGSGFGARGALAPLSKLDFLGRLLLPLQAIAVSVRAVAAGVLNQSHAFFPNDLCEMT
jgi:hypothetical protein